MLCLAVAVDFPTDPFNFPFISCHFLSAGGVWTQTGGPCLGRSSYMCWQPNCRTSLSWFHGTGFKAVSCRAVQYVFDPPTHWELLWSLHKKWSWAVSNSNFKRCRSAPAPAHYSSRTRFYLLEIFAHSHRMVSTYMFQFRILFVGRCCGM